MLGTMVPPIHHRSTLVLLAILVGLIVALVVVEQPAHRPSAKDALATLSVNVFSHAGFAGFIEERPVTSVSGSWKVPEVVGGPLNAEESTWVAVQDPRKNFIQIGTLYNAPHFGGPSYEAFWSSSQLGFHPKRLFDLNFGDVVTASISRASGGWRVRIRDSTDGERANFVTTDGAGASMYAGSWTQEDPALVTTSGPVNVPYPSLTAVSIRHPLIDGRAPSSPGLHYEVMATPNGYVYIPHLTANGDIDLTRGTPLQWRYLTAAYKLNVGYAALQLAAAQASPPYGLMARAVPSVENLIAAFTTSTASRAAKPSWPPTLVPKLIRLQGLNVEVARALVSFAHSPTSQRRTEWLQVEKAVNAAHRVSATIREAIGLPAAS
jgi:hypothetical protein